MQVRDEDLTVPPPAQDTKLASELTGDETSPAAASDDVAAARGSLFDDVEALIDDARTYVDAELSYQKTRASFVGNRVKKTIAFGIVAAFFAVLATIGLTVGLIIALTPLVTAWGATAIVVLAWLLVAYLLARKAGNAWGEASTAMSSPSEEKING
ncbi:phage holin family protein [Aurantiacibacter sediminis]|uniref:Phage holin family protein n=1 Tax=Aurantiacibacter sediminis TaxID=2793064 RepID=A0ABS0N3L3_9SPHN|nr:phage holin family protein [Aurantiacibacter sediminis]MBH5322565.1 phage holin family protein [Aurantiacibacter sediminis]